MATGSPDANSIFNRLKQLAGFKELNRNQMKLKIADMKKLNVRNMIKKAGYAGFALNEAIGIVTDASKVKGKTDVKAEKQRRADRASKKSDELQTEPMDSSKGRNLGPATKGKPKPEYSGGQRKAAENKSGANYKVKGKDKVKPKLRPNNLKDGGMPMVMKDGKKVPAYAADGIGKMNKGGMAMKKKPTTKMMAGGMAAKKKPAAKKMMAGGMAKKKMMAGGMTKSNYMYGGMAKKPKAKK